MASGGYSPSRRDASDAAGVVPDSSLLEEVLKETLASGSSGEAIRAEDLSPLVDVARRHRGVQLELEPVVVELVESILKARFGHMSRSPELWRHVSLQIASTLYESSENRERLKRFWDHLSELAR
jgi:hypothetical protein